MLIFLISLLSFSDPSKPPAPSVAKPVVISPSVQGAVPPAVMPKPVTVRPILVPVKVKPFVPGPVQIKK